ncbi:hypothetical protein [Photobacterium arenosum]|uniref:hypothetical protein n=1 Tax=Photobacterium arenosum TaxID=2774143 RepID=UPI00288ABE6D|nr:hypothetical protein [Photobacterium arenosum]
MSALRKLKYFKIEILKAIIAVFSLITIVLLSHYDKDAMIAFVMIQAIITIQSSCFDFGSNVYNMDVSHGELVFSQSSIDKKIYLLINGISLLAVYYFYHDVIGSYLFPFLILGSVGNVFLMRSTTVYRRSGLVLNSIIYFELSIVLVKMLSYPVLIMFGLDVFKAFLMLIPIIVAIVSFKYCKIDNLSVFKLFSFNDEKKIEIKYLIISASIAFKNQALSLFLPLVSYSNQGLVVVITRVNSVIILACSGINARIPSLVRDYIKDNSNNLLFQVYIILALMFLFSCLLLPFYIPEISTYFNYDYQVDYLSYEFLLCCIIFFSVVQSANQIVFQSMNRSKLSLISECIYILILFIIMNKV